MRPKNLFILLMLITLTSCVGTPDTKGYTETTVEIFNELTPPVVLFSKAKSMGRYSVTLQDGNGKIHYFGNVSTLANTIGESYEVKDTIKK